MQFIYMAKASSFLADFYCNVAHVLVYGGARFREKGRFQHSCVIRIQICSEVVVRGFLDFLWTTTS